MRHLSRKDKNLLRSVIDDALDRLLRFKASYDLHRYLLTKTGAEWSDLEVMLHASEYPIAGTGLSATRSILTAKDRDLTGKHYFDDVPLASEQHVQEAPTFPFAAASAAYAFSLLEDVGNAVVEIIYPGSIRSRSSWHAKVYGDADLTARTGLNAARDGLPARSACQNAKSPCCPHSALSA